MEKVIEGRRKHGIGRREKSTGVQCVQAKAKCVCAGSSAVQWRARGWWQEVVQCGMGAGCQACSAESSACRTGRSIRVSSVQTAKCGPAQPWRNLTMMETTQKPPCPCKRQPLTHLSTKCKACVSPGPGKARNKQECKNANKWKACQMVDGVWWWGRVCGRQEYTNTPAYPALPQRHGMVGVGRTVGWLWGNRQAGMVAWGGKGVGVMPRMRSPVPPTAS